ncbi:hypothetical protein BCON_0057g00060 [Botryotinia convoluta]|uniref:Uncharacterized protein n=1 Tax=Botryotinia convoluta TaxID=54673 RepID=A0A4Z1IGF9_9HELO|nr:hypothetical protein BCON_0057g00060 [Botryotinia convoluta]
MHLPQSQAQPQSQFTTTNTNIVIITNTNTQSFTFLLPPINSHSPSPNSRHTTACAFQRTAQKTIFPSPLHPNPTHHAHTIHLPIDPVPTAPRPSYHANKQIPCIAHYRTAHHITAPAHELSEQRVRAPRTTTALQIVGVGTILYYTTLAQPANAEMDGEFWECDAEDMR